MAFIDIGQLRCVDLPSMAGCLALSREAGWNQTAEDWVIFFEHGGVFGFEDETGRLAATSAILPYTGFAFVSLMLVRESCRDYELDVHVLKHCLRIIERRNLTPMLTAIPAAERIFEALGFMPHFGLARWQGQGGQDQSRPGAAGTAASPRVRPMTPTDLRLAAILDSAACGAERLFLLRNFHGRAPAQAFMLDRRGFVMARPGRVATQIGPLVAETDAEALELLDAALAAISGPVFIDVPNHCRAVVEALEARGFTRQRPFLRMLPARSAPVGDPSRLFAAAGPEFG